MAKQIQFGTSSPQMPESSGIGGAVITIIGIALVAVIGYKVIEYLREEEEEREDKQFEADMAKKNALYLNGLKQNPHYSNER